MIERRRSLRNDAAYTLAVLYTTGFLGVVFLVILKDIPKESAPIVQQLISIMSMIQAAIAGYFYGASKAATESNQAVARIAEAAPGVAAAVVSAAGGNGAVKAADMKVDVAGDVTVTQPEKDKP